MSRYLCCLFSLSKFVLILFLHLSKPICSINNSCILSAVNNFKSKNTALYHHHQISVMELGHLLARSGLTCPEVSSKVCLSSFCQSGSSASLPWVIYEAFCLHAVSSFSCIPAICPKLELFLTHLQFLYLFCNLFICRT
jgi:hypothetical protein